MEALEVKEKELKTVEFAYCYVDIKNSMLREASWLKQRQNIMLTPLQSEVYKKLFQHYLINKCLYTLNFSTKLFAIHLKTSFEEINLIISAYYFRNV